MSRYRWELLDQLGLYIEHARQKEAHDALDQVLRVFAALRFGGLAVRKMRCAQASSFCVRGAYRGGASSSEVLREHHEFLAKLSLRSTWKSVTTLVHEYVDELIGHVCYEHRSDMERVVQSIRRDLRASLDAPRTLSEYARAAGVSPGHLSRCFVEITGQTFRAERRRIRLEEAKRLLTETLLKINTVAHRVGLRDPSQFVVDFRRHTGVTPGEFRRLHQDTGDGAGGK